ncbi:MAG TPA: hypothetical protein VE173_06375 [Longimicrobiales bacterium]|nr:hypothetical protein [Longimicrobiales bacterium]
MRAPSGPRPRVFLLSPASLTGVRGRRILEGTSSADFAGPLHRGRAVGLDRIYLFISSLYFRGKLAYAKAFGRPGSRGAPPAYTITPLLGLKLPDHAVTLATLRAFARQDLDPHDPSYRTPLVESARRLGEELGARGRAVLLGSIATDKYLEPLLEALGPRLLVPETFAGRGDMSRGGLMLRAVEGRRELDYVSAAGAPRRGPRPPRLERR